MKYDKEFKEEALRLSDEIGARNAAEKLGIPKPTMRILPVPPPLRGHMRAKHTTRPSFLRRPRPPRERPQKTRTKSRHAHPSRAAARQNFSGYYAAWFTTVI
jgi:transposase-like protein